MNRRIGISIVAVLVAALGVLPPAGALLPARDHGTQTLAEKKKNCKQKKKSNKKKKKCKKKPSPTPTPTATAAPTATPTSTSSAVPTASPTVTATSSPTPSPTPSPSPTPAPPLAPPFVAAGTIMFSSPATTAGGLGGLTENEFSVSSCPDMPVLNGFDGFVVELPEDVTKVGVFASAVGGDVSGSHDLDLSFYAADCSFTGSSTTGASDETSAVPLGTHFVVVNAVAGALVDFTLTVG